MHTHIDANHIGTFTVRSEERASRAEYGQNFRGPADATPTLSIGYLISQYPAISHTFILREIRILRDAGFRVCVSSINGPDREVFDLTEEEWEEYVGTFYVKRRAALELIPAHLMTLLGRPLGYIRGIVSAVSLAGPDLKRLLYAPFYFSEALIIGRWMRQNDVSHLHVHFATSASTVALIASRIFPIRFSLTVHGPDEFYDTSIHQLSKKIAGAAFIACIGDFARSQLMKLSPHCDWSKFEISPLGVDSTVFSPVPRKLSPSPFEVLCVGRLVSAKGQHLLLKAVARLVEAGYDIRLRLVGDGPDRMDLEQAVGELRLQDHVVFAGAVNQDQIRAFYLRADAFVLASFAEGIPVVLMEAMATEIPCVATRIMGIPELIRDGIDGILVPASDDAALSNAISRLIEDPRLCEQLGKSGRRRVTEMYDLNRNTKRLAGIFRRRLEAQ